MKSKINIYLYHRCLNGKKKKKKSFLTPTLSLGIHNGILEFVTS